MTEERLRLHRINSRVLEIVADDGQVAEYPIRANLDVETIATFLELEEVLTGGKHPDTGQPLTGNEQAHYYRLAHDRVITVIKEQTPKANLSLDLNELLATMALMVGNVSFAQGIAEDLAKAAGVELQQPGETDDPTTGPGLGQEPPFVPSETPSPSSSSDSESETNGGQATGETSPGTSSSGTLPTPVNAT